MESLIRWKKGDYVKLSKAISRYNKLINESDLTNLPELQNYTRVKSEITTRSELNRVINSLKRANKSNLYRSVTFDSGESLSEYEYNELRKQRTQALRSLTTEQNKILSERLSIGMGDERLSEISAIKESLNLETKSEKAFLDTVERIKKLGVSDRKMKKAIQFRENFYKALEGTSNFKNYEALKKKLDSIKNPHKFHEYVRQSPVLMDLFLWYKNTDDLQYGSFSSNEEAFNSTLMFHLGIENIDV